MPAKLLKFIRPNKRAEELGAATDAEPSYAHLTPDEREFLPHLLEIQETPPSPLKRWLLWTIVATVAVLITWASIGEIDVVATAPGKLIPDGRVKVMQPVETATVRAIHVHEGQHVKVGDLLIELDPTLSAADVDSSTLKYQQNTLEQARLVAELKGGLPAYAKDASPTEISLQEALREARLASYEAKRNSARATVEEKKNALGSSLATLKKTEITLDIAKEREQKMAALEKEQFVSRMSYLQYLQELQGATQDLEAQHKTVEELRAAKRQADEQLQLVEREWRASILTDIDHDQVAQPSLKRDQEKAERMNNLKWLRAPVDGYVQAVGVTTIGGVVTPAQNLVSIVPDDTPLVVEASLSNEDIGYVHVGQKVDIKIDTYPFQKYGTLSGTLEWVSPDADAKSNNQSGNTQNSAGGDNSQDDSSMDSGGQKSAKSAYTYKVHVRPDAKATLIVDGKPAPLQAGMTVQADVKTDHRRVIEFFLSPVSKYLDEGMKVR